MIMLCHIIVFVGDCNYEIFSFEFFEFTSKFDFRVRFFFFYYWYVRKRIIHLTLQFFLHMKI